MKAVHGMMGVTMRIGSVAACAVALAGCPGEGGGMFGGADPREFTSLDADGNDSVTREEFSKWGKDMGLLDAFVEKGAKTVSETTLAQGLYQMWNLEGGDLNEGEWNEGIRTFFPNADAGSYADWDLDTDGILDEQEMIAGLAHTDLLSEFDEDNNGDIATNELLSRFYQIFDQDNDEKLVPDEWTSGLGRWNWPI